MNRHRTALTFTLLLLLLALLLAANLCIGSSEIAPHEIPSLLLHGGDEAKGRVLLEIRLPRLLCAALLGGGLSLSGYLLQVFFANPIAGPFVLGVSSGAKLTVAALLVLMLGRGQAVSSAGMVGAAFAGALVSMLFVLLISRRVERMSVLVICGVMIGYLCSAATEFLVTFADDSHIVNLHNWSMGSFSGMSWDRLRWIAPLVLGCAGAALLLSKPMGAYQLGEVYARNLGVPLRRLRLEIILLSSLLSACVTAFAGPVSFVGVAVPHLAKRMLGSAKPLAAIPACLIGGADFCLFCDLLSRSLFAPTELSIGSVTAVFGAPVVIWIMLSRQEGRGSA